jgi:hypothetical protein
VWCDDQLVGRVIGVRYGSSVDRPDTIVVRLHGMRREVVELAIQEVARIDPEHRSLDLLHDPSARRHGRDHLVVLRDVLTSSLARH